jgi:hypothetical protein
MEKISGQLILAVLELTKNSGPLILAVQKFKKN